MEDLKLVEVIISDVGEPRRDWTRSGPADERVYDVPISLNRNADLHEANLLVTVWRDEIVPGVRQCPELTVPGRNTSRVDRIVLRATTIDEIERLQEPLRSLLMRVNEQARVLRNERAEAEAAAREEEEARRIHIKDVASRLDF